MESITNRLLISEFKSSRIKATISWLQKNFANSNRRTVERYVVSNVKYFQKLSKNKTNNIVEIEAFLDKIIEFPVNTPSQESETSTLKSIHPPKSTNNTFTPIAKDLMIELNEALSGNIDTQLKLNSKIQENKILKIKNSHLERFKCENGVLSSHNKRLLKRNSGLLNRIQENNLAIKRTKCREEYHRCKVQRLETLCHFEDEQNSEVEYIEKLVSENENLKKEKADLVRSIQYCEDLLQDSNDKNVYLFDEDRKRYNYKCQMCVYELLNHNVSVSKLSSVIETVLKLTDHKCKKLPSKSTIIEMNVQRLALSQRHIGEVFSKKESSTLLTDETSKKGVKYMGYEGSDRDGKLWVLGMREIETKSAADTLKVFKEILSDIDQVSTSSENENSKLILKHIVATMSDRAATEVKFNTLLQDYKTSLLPVIIENFETLSPVEQNSISKLGHFFCGLHALVHFADTCQKAILETEKGFFDGGVVPIFDKHFLNSTESGTLRLIRTASKAFAAGADEKSGCFGPFVTFVDTFLKEHMLKSVPLQPFRGARFNILFSNAAAVYFLHKQMLLFLQKYGAENRLLKSVLQDLETPEFIAGSKALGLICYFITSPLWTLIEAKTVNILDMNVHYNNLLLFLESFDDSNIDEFINGNKLVFGEDTYVKRDCILDNLLQPSPYDNLVIVYLRIIFPALSLLCRHLFKDHLPGGILAQLDINDQELRNKYRSVPKSSKYAESVFGLLDYILRQKPNVTTLASEAYILFAQNKTLGWLESKGEQDQENILRDARKHAKLLHQKFKERKSSIQAERQKSLDDKIKKREQEIRNRIKRLEGYTTNMIDFGLWQTVSQVDEQLQSYSSNHEKIAGLKAQINFRQFVLKQGADKEYYKLSKVEHGKRKLLTVPELANNVKKLVQSASESVNNSSTDGQNILVNRRVKLKFKGDTESSELVWYTGKVISQVQTKLMPQTRCYLST